MLPPFDHTAAFTSQEILVAIRQQRGRRTLLPIIFGGSCLWKVSL